MLLGFLHLLDSPLGNLAKHLNATVSRGGVTSRTRQAIIGHSVSSDGAVFFPASLQLLASSLSP